MRNFASKPRGWFGPAAILLTAALAAPAANVPPPMAPGVDSHRAAVLFRDIKASAAQVQSAARYLNELAAEPNVTWLQLDRQWNLIKPAVEDMQFKLWRLEAMKANLPAAQRKDVDQSKDMIAVIRSRTHRLRVLLDRPGVRTNDPKFQTDAGILSYQATNLLRAASAG